MKTTSISVVLILVISMMVGVDLGFDMVPKVEGATITVDDDGPADYSTIQEAVDAAGTWDDVYVYNGYYYGEVTVNKPISITGESRDNTRVRCNPWWGFKLTVDGVAISGFKFILGGPEYGGVHVESYSNSISGNRFEGCTYGIKLVSSYGNSITGNIFSSNSVGILLESSGGNTISGNTISSNNDCGILASSSNGNIIRDNTISSNSGIGIYIFGCGSGQIKDNTISNNYIGIFLQYSNGLNIENNIISSSSQYGIQFDTNINHVIKNCEISNSGSYDIFVEGYEINGHGISINSTFNSFNASLAPGMRFSVRWYLHVVVKDYLGNVVPNAKVKIEDNKNGFYKETFTCDENGYLKWIQVTEYIEQDLNGDEWSEKVFHTPHRIIAWNDTLVGYAYPDPVLDLSKTITITLYNGTLVELGPGSSLISLPRPPQNIDIQTLLQSMEGRYDSVQWYNESDTEDPWKHYQISKPSSMNDLKDLDNSMGLWLHITDPQGATLVVFGDKPTSNQTIQLYSGWNLVSYPSLTNHNRTVGLNNLDFGIEVDAIQWFDSSTKTWHFLEEGDSFEVGRGYWIHAKTDCVWEVPL